jgi:DNA-binding NarL/FixJ family response regulator
LLGNGWKEGFEMGNDLENARRRETIVIVDDNERFLSSAKRILNEAGFEKVVTSARIDDAMRLLASQSPEMFLVDIHLNDDGGDGLFFTKMVRRSGYKGKIVVLSGDKSSSQFFKAARAGANDFLVKGPKVDLPAELKRIFDEKRENATDDDRALAVKELGYLRTFGLTPREIEILVAYAEDFPLQKILSDRVGKAESQIRKSFSRIQAKLGIDNLAQLGYLLTVCAMFEREN